MAPITTAECRQWSDYVDDSRPAEELLAWALADPLGVMRVRDALTGGLGGHLTPRCGSELRYDVVARTSPSCVSKRQDEGEEFLPDECVSLKLSQARVRCRRCDRMV
jgi:hypothetical protein